MTTGSIALEANAANNAMHQQLRLERWTSVRDELWNVVEPLLQPGARVALVGAGSCDDVPVQRIAERASLVDLVDFDAVSTERALGRVGDSPHVRAIVDDVTGGSADVVLHAVRDSAPLPGALPLPYGPIANAPYDLVIGDMLYTQLLHSGLIALGVFGERQLELMRRYDPHLTRALVMRIQASLAAGGHAVHVHDLACWTNDHPQPLSVEEVLDDPDVAWKQLRRHDACDPHLVLGSLGAKIVRSAWWRWPFEPNKQFVVRATVARSAPLQHVVQR